MDELKYENRTYIRYNGKWVDSSGIAAPIKTQNILNQEFEKQLDLSKLSVDQLESEADKLKDADKHYRAIKYYEEIASKCDINKLRYLLPKLSSCYRKCNMPQKSIELFASAEEKYGQSIIDEVLLTTVGAAYCDLKEFDKAKKCCNEAYAKCNGKCSQELISVYERIKKEGI